MKENIFENAKFGDKFQTRDGKVAIYISKTKVLDTIEQHRLVIESLFGGEPGDVLAFDDGRIGRKNEELPYDIVSYYQEEIDEEKL